MYTHVACVVWDVPGTEPDAFVCERRAGAVSGLGGERCGEAAGSWGKGRGSDGGWAAGTPTLAANPLVMPQLHASLV